MGDSVYRKVAASSTYFFNHYDVLLFMNLQSSSTLGVQGWAPSSVPGTALRAARMLPVKTASFSAKYTNRFVRTEQP